MPKGDLKYRSFLFCRNFALLIKGLEGDVVNREVSKQLIRSSALLVLITLKQIMPWV